MDKRLRSHADQIVAASIAAVQPDAAVQRALEGKTVPGRVVLVAAGKAAWQMAKAAYDCLGSRIDDGVVVTKYGHVKGPIAGFACCEAGHPVPDENSFAGTAKALALVEHLEPQDTVLFLLRRTGKILQTDSYGEVDDVRREAEELKDCLEKAREAQMQRMQSSKENITVAYLYLNLLQETRELTSSLRHLLRASKGFRE